MHLDEVRTRREDLVTRTMAAVKDRLTKEITYWDHRANQLKDQELAGKINAKINSGKARQRADELQARLQRRMAGTRTGTPALAFAACRHRRVNRRPRRASEEADPVVRSARERRRRSGIGRGPKEDGASCDGDGHGRGETTRQ